MPDDLVTRTALPEPLRILVAEMPRLSWPGQPGFGGLAAFWLERHLDFRLLCDAMRTNVEATLGQGMDPGAHGAELRWLGAALTNSLQGHHYIEDAHYFPQMQLLDPRVGRGFDILDRDHHALDGLLAAFKTRIGAVLRQEPDAVAQFHAGLADFERHLNRHLEDEEEIVIPTILRHGLG